MITKIARISCLGLMVGLLMLCLVTVGEAKKDKEKAKDKAATEDTTQTQEEVVDVKKMRGKVACFSPRKNPKLIAITVKEENNKYVDYLFYIDENVEIERKESLKEIQVGDTVELTYDVIKITEIKEEAGKEEPKVTEKIKRVAKVVRFLERKPVIEGIYTSGTE